MVNISKTLSLFPFSLMDIILVAFKLDRPRGLSVKKIPLVQIIMWSVYNHSHNEVNQNENMFMFHGEYCIPVTIMVNMNKSAAVILIQVGFVFL